MKRYLLLLAASALSLGACQKQQSEAEHNAEIERQVQERLSAEHQAAEEQKLAQRQADLDAREQTLSEKENRAATATPLPLATVTPAAALAGANNPETASYATFYQKLDSYGDWIETSDYGYVFQPREAAQAREWRPYTNGHWVYTDAGWTWISDEPFGWATYHYGRWIRLRSVGWVWVPGEQWAPAWVSWREGDDYVGWAPLPPEAQFDRQTGIRNWADNYYDIGPDQYAFVPANEFGRKLTSREIVPTQRNVTIINQTTNITNITYENSVVVNRGPTYDNLRKRSRQPIERLRLERTQNLNEPRPIIRGQVVALPTVAFHSSDGGARPNRVARKIAQPVVERGWSEIQDSQAGRKARSKMKAEAIPPANLPPKRFVRPTEKSLASPRSTPMQSGRIVAPYVSRGNAIPVGTPAPLPSTPPSAPPSAAPSRTPERAFPPAAADRDHPQRTQSKRKEGQDAPAERRTEREQEMLGRKAQNGKTAEPPPGAKPTPQASASPAATETPVATQLPNETSIDKRSNRRGEKKQRRGKAASETSPEPNVTATPTARRP
ncbi:MAG TPA: DUF6600 domain-containing protein [Chthoniobacterales bacterium]